MSGIFLSFFGGGSAVQGLTATGGVISDYTSGPAVYRAHVFASSGTFSVTAPGGYGDTVEYLVVAGGGGGANPSMGLNRIAGSGAGGMLTGSAFPVSPGPYTITIGNGGAGNGPTPNRGGPSSFGPTITSHGGGGGGVDDPAPTAVGTPGGSGGGAWYTAASGGSGNRDPSNNPTPQQGYAGSPGFGFPEYGGGGGGAGGVGTRRYGGPGAPSSISGTSVTYAAGGESSDFPGTDRTANGTASTGGGGSGRGSGGSGIVVVRYQIASLTATAKATGGLISFYSGKTIHTFTSSGTFAITNPGLSSVEYVVVAGGGGTLTDFTSGGGAGGFRTGPAPVSSSPGSYSITVGGGGSNTKGSNSTFGPTITATGGAGSPSTFGGAGNIGGSGSGGGIPGGGGGAGNEGGFTPAEGFAGGSGFAPGNRGTGGGGGAGGVGGAASSGTGGGGGIGVQVPSTFQNPVSAPSNTTNPQPYQRGGGLGTPGPGGSYYLAGGGGGIGESSPGNGSGGAGGGGAGGPTGNGLVNTGGGGGGGNNGGGTGTLGGSGIVIIAYPS